MNLTICIFLFLLHTFLKVAPIYCDSVYCILIWINFRKCLLFLHLMICLLLGFPGGASGKESTCQCRRYKRPGFNHYVGKSSWRRKWQPISVFLLRKSQGQRSLVVYSPWDHKRDRHDWTHIITSFYLIAKLWFMSQFCLDLPYVTLSLISYSPSENYFLYACLLYSSLS